MLYFSKVLQIMAIANEWSTKALSDGKVTLMEAVELATRIAGVLGIGIDIDLTQVKALEIEPVEEEEEINYGP